MSCSDCISSQVEGAYAFYDKIRRAKGDPALHFSGSMELTLRCNVRCKHCYILYPGATSGEMSTSQVNGVLDILAEDGVLHLLVTGGEPLTRPDFREIWTHAKQLGLLLTLYSNATLIDESMAAFLAGLPPRRAEVTIYGHTEGTYEVVTGVKGSFRRFRRGVALLLEHGIRLSLKTMVLKTNVHEFNDMKAWAEGLGCRFRWDSMVNPRLDRDPGPTAERLDPEELADFEDRFEGARETYLHIAEAMEKSAPTDRLFTCGAGVRTFHIDPQGRLHPCMLYRASPYDLLERPLKEGWREHIGVIRDMKAPVEGCNSCSQRGLCGNCAGESLLEMGDPTMSVPYHCKVGEIRDRRWGASAPVFDLPARRLTEDAGEPCADERLNPVG